MINLYRKHYIDLQFERSGLFELIGQAFKCNQALYPGCFVHITPSLYLPHVVYIDWRPEAQTFFADLESVSQFVERNKHYRRSAYIRFIGLDFTAPLPLPKNSFDLLISIFAAGSGTACQRYLKPGGLLLTNRPQEATQIDFELLFAIRFRGGKYLLVERDQVLQSVARYNNKRTSHDLRQGNRGLQYAENEIYYLYKKRPKHGLGFLP